MTAWRAKLRFLALCWRAYHGDTVAAVELWRILTQRRRQLIRGPER